MFTDPPKDKFGLPKITLDGGASEASDRSAIRAPMLTGGTITGRNFQTDAVNPRIVLDSTQFVAYDSTGAAKVTIDVATGNITTTGGTFTGGTFQTSSTDPRIIIDTANGLRVIDSGGVEAYRLDATNGLRVRGLTGYALTRGVSFWDGTTLLGALSGYFTSPVSSLQVNVSPTGAAGSAYAADLTVRSDSTVGFTSTAQLNVFTAAAGNSLLQLSYQNTGTFSQLLFQTPNLSGMFKLRDDVGIISYIGVRDATARMRFGTGSGGNTNSVDFIDGNLVFQVGNKYTGNIAGQGAVVGMKMTTTAAQQWGHSMNWRHVRTDTNGAAVTPGSVTFGTPSVNTNANTPTITSLGSSGGVFKLSSTASGVTDYANTLTVN